MDYNKLITPVQLKILNDTAESNELESKSLEELLPNGELRAVKGPRRPESWKEKNCFTVHIPSNPRDPDTKTHNGTMRINHYCPNYNDGNANVELMGPIANRLLMLFDDWWPNISGYEVANWAVEEPLGPLHDPEAPEEHYTSIKIDFFIRKL